jgi:hypothetical protein
MMPKLDLPIFNRAAVARSSEDTETFGSHRATGSGKSTQSAAASA